MEKWRQRLRAPGVACGLWVALCFGLTSAVYLSWLDRLVKLAGSGAADWVSLVAGYAAQAMGAGLACLWLRRDADRSHLPAFVAASALLAALAVPALLVEFPAGAVGFGLAINLVVGAIAGAYLYALARRVAPERRGRAFGGGYALATVAVGLLALIGWDSLLHGRYALLLYLPGCAAMALAAKRGAFLDAAADEPADGPAPDVEPACLGLACGVVFLLSAVKNLGFSFPSADIEAGLVPELSRLPYAVGLAVAGILTDRNRKGGMICTVAALVIPFIMLGLTAEPVSATVFWGLDYLFYAFFTVFRAVLLLDMAGKTRRWALAPLGLVAGRLGDVAGTAVGLMLAGRRVALIAATGLLFFPTVYLFLLLYRRAYEPEKVQERSEQEVFEAFCLRNDISKRERDVLRMILDNHSNGEIAEALFIAESTVKYHVRNVLQKAGCKNRGELQRKYALALYPRLEGEAARADRE